MTPEAVFQIANGTAPIAWAAMIIAPRAKFVQHVILSGAFVLLLASAYALIILSHFEPARADFMSLEGVTAMLNDPWAMTAGWIHYLAFDMLAGIIITKKGLDMKMNRWALLPCQLGCFMLGPVGILLFAIATKATGRKWVQVALN